MKEREEKKEKPMRRYGDCSFCGGEVKEKNVELDYRYQNELYIFQEVPTGVCQQCGEMYLHAEIAKTIEREIQSGDEWTRTKAVPVKTFDSIAV